MAEEDVPNELQLAAACDQLQSAWAAGARLPAEYFALRHPALFADPEVALALVLLEVALREDAGEVVALAELVTRFPQLEAPLQFQMAFRAQLWQPPAPLPEPPPPTDLGELSISGYEIVREIGRGGMGTVYEARQPGLNRRVALKMIGGGFPAGDRDLARLTTEAEAISRLQHPNVVQIYEVGDHRGHPFLALELVEGGTLADQLRGGPLAPRAAAGLIETLARAAHAVHERGIVHRDLKPANVLFTRAGDEAPPGVPKLTDFGLAKLLDGTGHPTRTGETLGTPGYMAPEQITGGQEIGPAADVYGLGAILYEALTGRPPFHGATAVETWVQVSQSDPLPLSRLRAGIPRDLQTICLKCLEKAPVRRYASAAALADELGRFLRGEPVQARPVGLLGRLEKRVRRRPLVSALVVTLAATVLLGMAGVTWEWREATRLAAEEARQRDKAEVNLYRARVAQAALLWQSNNFAAAKEHLELARPLFGRPDHRGWEWHYLNRLLHAEVATLEHRFWVRGVAVSPDGNELGVACGDPEMQGNPGRGELVVWDLRTRTPLWRTGAEETVSVGYSSDGRYLACATVSGVTRVFDRATRQERFAWRDVPGLLALAFRPDGRHLATLSGSIGGRIVVRDLATGAEVASRPQDHQQSWCAAPVYSSDGKRLCAVGPGNVLRFWDPIERREERIPTGEPDVHAIALTRAGLPVTVGSNGGAFWPRSPGQEPVRQPFHTGRLYASAASPAGEIIATGGSDHTVRVWNAATGREVLTLRGHTWTVRALAFAPDGNTLVSGGQDRFVKLWDLTRDPRGRFLDGDGWVNAVAFGPGDRVRASFHPGRIRDWLVPSGQRLAYTKLTDVSRELVWPRYLVELSADGRRFVATGDEDKRVAKVWDAETGLELVSFKGHTLPVQAVAFSPDGRWAASAGWDRGPDPRGCEVRVWDATTGTERAGFEVPQTRVICLAFSPDGERLAVGGSVGKGTSRVALLTLWNITTGTQYAGSTEHQGMVTAVAFSPNGRQIASVGAGDQNLCLLDASDGRLLQNRSAVHSPTGVAFSPDGRRLAVIGYEGIVSLRDTDDGTEVFRLPGLVGNREGDMASAARVRFSSDGGRLISTNWDGTLNLWDGRELSPGPQTVVDPGP